MAVVRHVLENFAHYDRGDCKVKNKEAEVKQLLAEVNHEATRVNDEEFEEGSEKLKLHRYRERNNRAAREKKEEALAAGRLRCEACGIDYLAAFKKVEAFRIIECHHKIPLASLNFSGTTKKSELALLCANCHRLAHSRTPPLTIEEVRNRRMSANRLLQPTPASGRG